jgi:membrane fusion protein, multidrug efflux system
MDNRKLSVLSGILIFIATLALSWYIVSVEEEEEEASQRNEGAVVLMMEYAPQTIQSTIRFTGRVVPFDQYDIYAEVTGIFEESDRSFKTGTSFNRGEVLLRMNDDEEQQDLEAARYEFAALISQILPDISIDYSRHHDEWQAYLDELDATDSLQPLPEVDDRQFRMFLNRENVYSRFSSIRRQEVRLQKFTIRAPYDGVLTDHAINPGALVQNGQQLGQFTGVENLEIEASIPASEARYISVGDEVTVQTEGYISDQYRAVISRKNAVIDPGTQSLKVFMEISGSEFEPGNYLEGEIMGQSFDDAFKVHKDILVRDNELFVVENDRSKLQTVELLASAGDSMIVTGLEPGTKIIDEFRNAAFEDAKVTEREDQ